MIGTYAELQSAVTSAMGRSDIPDYVYSLATRELANRLRLRDMETTATVAIVAGTATIALPSGFAMLRAAYLDTDPRMVLDVVSPWFSDAVHDATGRPQTIAVTGDTLTLNPTPDAAYDVVLRYVGELAEFVEPTDTNDVLTRFPALYLYAALKHACLWGQDFEMAAIHAQAMENEARRVEKADKLARYPAPLRSRALSTP